MNIIRLKISCGLLLSAALFLGSCKAPQAKQEMPPPPGVTVAKPFAKSIVEWDRYVGRFAAIESVDVRARVSGYLDSLEFAEGTIVKKGDPLAAIDPRPFQAEMAQAKAALAESQARLERSSALLAQAKANEASANSQRDLAKKRLNRAQDAAKTNAIAKEQVDVRESELQQAEASVEEAKAAIASANADISTSKAAIETAKASVDVAKLNLSYTYVKAPISGRIGDRLVTVGNWVQGGTMATLLTTIISTDPIHVYFDANEQAFLKYMRLNRAGKRQSSRDVKNPVFVALMDEQGYPHRGHMDFVDNRIDANTGTMRARAILRNENGLLTPGLFATVQIPGSSRHEALLLPDRAIGSQQSSRFVYIVNADNTVEVRPVVLGPLAHGLRVIRSGITADDNVVVSGIMRIRPGASVNPQISEIESIDIDNGLPDSYEPVPESEWIRGPQQQSNPQEGGKQK